MRKFWAIAALNLLILGGISAHAIMAILAGHAVSGIGAPDALTWGMASVGPLALLVIAVLAVRLNGRRSPTGESLDPAIAADLPGSFAVNADEAAKSRLSRFARPLDLGTDPAPIEKAAPDDAETLYIADDSEDHVGTRLGDEANEGGADDWHHHVADDPNLAPPVEQPFADGGQDVCDDAAYPRFSEEEAFASFDSGEPRERRELPAASDDLSPAADWIDAPGSAGSFEPVESPLPSARMEAIEGLPISSFRFAMPAERHDARWDWVYAAGGYGVAPSTETGFPWVTAGIAHVAAAIAASRLLPMGSQAAAEARGWREAVAGFVRSEPIDPADREAFVGWINSLDTGDDVALRSAIDGALEALKAEAQRNLALAACLPARFGVEQDGEAGGIALAG